jgi:DNA-binding winged helix-turn-helix (wHTH) protein
VWRRDGAVIDLRRRRQLWQLLEVMVSEGGSATKEQLVMRIWDVAEYHPLKHDPKLYVSIQKLRTAIEPEPANPTLVKTAESGYTLSTPLRIVSARESETAGG